MKYLTLINESELITALKCDRPCYIVWERIRDDPDVALRSKIINDVMDKVWCFRLTARVKRHPYRFYMCTIAPYHLLALWSSPKFNGDTGVHYYHTASCISETYNTVQRNDGVLFIPKWIHRYKNKEEE